MRGSRLLLLTLALGLVFLGGCWGPRNAKLAVGDVALEAGAMGKVGVFVINPPDVKTIQVGPIGALTFDPTVLRVTAVRGVNGFQVLSSTIDNLAGIVQFAAGFPGGALGPGPFGVRLAVVELEVQAVGTPGSSCELNITAVDVLADRKGKEIPLTEIIPGKAEVK